MIEGDELKAYLKSLAEYNEIKDITSTAFCDGERAKAMDVARILLTKGFDAGTIAEITKLTIQQIEALKLKRV